MAENVKNEILKANARDLLLFRTIPDWYRSLQVDLSNELVEMGGFANLRIGNGISSLLRILSHEKYFRLG